MYAQRKRYEDTGARPKTNQFRAFSSPRSNILNPSPYRSMTLTEILSQILTANEIQADSINLMFTEVYGRIEKEALSWENTVVLIKGIARTCDFTFERQAMNKELQNFVDCRALHSKLTHYIVGSLQQSATDEILSFFSDLCKILEKTSEILPTYSLTANVTLISLISSSVKNRPEFSEISRLVAALEDTLEGNLKQVKSVTVKDASYGREPPYSFRKLPVMPTIGDILMEGRPFLRRNIIHGPYKDVEHYLDIHFRLIREDFLIPLRDSILTYKADQKDGNVVSYLQNARLYKNVYIREMQCKNDGMLRRVNFDVSSLSKVNWEITKRFMNGAIVCLSKDNFNTIVFGVVCERTTTDLERGILFLKIDGNEVEMLGNNPFQIYDMIESVAYFEACRYNLLALQGINENTLPMKKYILNQETSANPPVYLLNSCKYDLQCLLTKECLQQQVEGKKMRAMQISTSIASVASSKHTSGISDSENIVIEETEKSLLKADSINVSDRESISSVIDDDSLMKYSERRASLTKANVNSSGQEEMNKDFSQVDVLNDDSWPSLEQTEMNESQLNALKAALTKEFAIIHGPPGTGKTYVGLKLMEVLLENIKVWSPATMPKILIACYTNHALDKFLEGILDINSRIGINRNCVRIGGNSRCSERLKQYNLNNLVRSNDFLKRERAHEISKTTDLLATMLCGVLDIKEIELFIGDKNVNALKNRHIERNLVSTPILLYWLSMGECSYYTVKGDKRDDINTNLKEKNVNEPENDDNEEILRIMSDVVDINQEEKSTKRYSVKFDRNGEKMWDISDKVSATYDDIDSFNNINNAAHRYSKWFSLYKGRKHFKPIMLNQLKQSAHMEAKEARQIISNQLWKMPESDRWRLYRYWALQYYDTQVRSMREMCRNYETAVDEGKDDRKQQQLRGLRNANIIGVTTTGAAKYRDLIEEIKPQIVIIEEAAEILEAHIITTLTEFCEHLILIGDHQQLRPNPTTFELARNFKLDISLFERMVKNNLHLNSLRIQHRMRPAISKLLVPYIYTDLVDHSSVLSHPNISGVDGNLYFINHSEMEQEGKESRSHSNIHEAKIIVGFCRYLLRQGYLSHQVTVLTTYRGQEFVIRNEMRSVCDLIFKTDKERKSEKESFVQSNTVNRGIRVATVDNFQGEENDIILLSLVRSNESGKIGFLNASNRICVALSRAKHGFYAFGNMNQLQDGSKIWKAILGDNKGSVTDYLPLACQNHPKTVTQIKSHADFANVPDGGCRLPCEFRLECGHACVLLCHPYDQPHEEYLCKKNCTRSCERDHQCKYECYECFPGECKNCDVQVDKIMPICNHLQVLPCFQDPAKHSCIIGCEKSLNCGHSCKELCGESCTRDCEEILKIQSKKCRHFQEIKCHEDPTKINCEEDVIAELNCGHLQMVKCYEYIATVQCHTEVDIKTCKAHKIQCKCYQSVKLQLMPCKAKVAVICPVSADHKFEVHCSEVNNAICPEKCTTILECGHTCKNQCGACYLASEHLKCATVCDADLPCRHKCRGNCSLCRQVGKHLICSVAVRKKSQLPCDHNTENQGYCGYLPSKCKEPCKVRCGHRVCRKKCGEECEPCKKPCVWKCAHQRCNKMCYEMCDRTICNKLCEKTLECGHSCPGYCGEPCLSSCVKCHKNLYINIAKKLNYIMQRGQGYVLLLPCNHIVEGLHMDKYVRREMDEMLKSGKVDYLRCPYCQVAICYCPRYANDIKVTLQRISSVKELISMEQLKLEFLFQAVDNSDRKLHLLQQKFTSPCCKSAFISGVLCLLQATIAEYKDLDNKLRYKGPSKVSSTIFDLSKNEIESASEVLHEQVHKVMRLHIKEETDVEALKYFAITGIECLLRAKLASLDWFIKDDRKRHVLYLIEQILLKMERRKCDDDSKRVISEMFKICHLLNDNFTLQQNNGIKSLMKQIVHFFKPVIDLIGNIGQDWRICQQGAAHLVKTSNEEDYVGGQCSMCENTLDDKQPIHALFAMETDIKMASQELYKKIRSILNKLTPQKFPVLMTNILELEINTEERLLEVVNIILEKAIAEPRYRIAYANACKVMAKHIHVISSTAPNEKVTLKKLLLNRCQKEFEKKVDKADTNDQNLLTEEMKLEESKAKRRSFGHIRFLAELFKLGMCTERIMHNCIMKLLKAKDEESLECFCRLLTTTGKSLDHTKAKPLMDQYFAKIDKIIKLRQTSPKIRFILQDLQDLRLCKWKPKRDDNAPKTIAQIHKEAAEEKVEKGILHQRLSMESRYSFLGSALRGRGGMVQSTDEHGWQSVGPVKTYRLDQSIMKISKTNVDESYITLGPGRSFGGWGRGSTGDGKNASQEGEKPSTPGKRFSALSGGGSQQNTGAANTENDSRRGNAMSRGGMSQGGRDSRGRLAPRQQNSRSYSRGSQDKEHDAAIQAARNISAGHGDSDRLTPGNSRNQSRESSQNRDLERRVESPSPVPPKDEMDKETVERKSKSTIDEYLSIHDLKEAIECTKEIPGSLMHIFGATAIQHVLERSGVARRMTGTLLHDLVKNNVLSVEQYLQGLMETLEFAEDMEIDIPKIWQYLGELIGPMVQDGSVPLVFLKSACEPLLNNNKAGLLVSEVLNDASHRLGHVKVGEQWKNSGLVWTDFMKSEAVQDFISTHKLEYTVESDQPLSPVGKGLSEEKIQMELDNLIKLKGVENEKVFDWVVIYVGESNTKKPSFIRALMTSVCSSAIVGSINKATVDAERLKKHGNLLQKYMDHNAVLELQALYALQALVHKLQHPPDVLRILFDLLYDEDIISEDAFNQWESSDDPAEQSGKGVARSSVVQFYRWLREAEEAEEEEQ